MIFVFVGVEDGQIVRMFVGKREIFIMFRVQKSFVFWRDGVDIYFDFFIFIVQVFFGGIVRVQGLYEMINVMIFFGIQIDQKIWMGGKGIFWINSYGYGDYYIYIKI